MNERGRTIDHHPLRKGKSERDLFVSPVAAVDGRLIRPNDLLVDLDRDPGLERRLVEAGGRPYRPGDKDRDFRQRAGAPDYGDINERVRGAGIELWTGFDTRVVADLVERERAVHYNHVLVGTDFYHGGPGGPPTVVPGPVGKFDAGKLDGIADIAVLDNGLPRDWRDLHPELEQVVGRFGIQALPLDPLDEGPPGGTPDGILDKQAGHGLFICGVIHRVAPELNVNLHRVLHASGEGDETLLIATLQELADSVRVINLSLGAQIPDGAEEPKTAEVIRKLKEAGKIIVASAGNAGCSDPRTLFPASMAEVLAVGAYDSTMEPYERWSHSCYGDVYAPGVDVLAAHVRWNGPIDWPEAPGPKHFAGWAKWSGTSFAAPLVAAELARLLAEDHEGTPQDMVDAWLAQLPREAWRNKPSLPDIPRYDPPIKVTDWD